MNLPPTTTEAVATASGDAITPVTKAPAPARRSEDENEPFRRIRASKRTRSVGALYIKHQFAPDFYGLLRLGLELVFGPPPLLAAS